MNIEKIKKHIDIIKKHTQEVHTALHLIEIETELEEASNQVQAVVMPNGVIAGGRKRWKPKEKEIFYYVNFYTGVTEQIYTNSKIHTPRNLYKIGNCYKTKEEAQIKWNQIKKILLQR